MIRIGSSSTISGLITPAAAILAGNYDPASGSGTFSAPMPSVGQYVEGYVRYANASDGTSNTCTFNMRITRGSLASFTLHLWVGEIGTNCTVPNDVTNSTGVFTDDITLIWTT